MVTILHPNLLYKLCDPQPPPVKRAGGGRGDDYTQADQRGSRPARERSLAEIHWLGCEFRRTLLSLAGMTTEATSNGLSVLDTARLARYLEPNRVQLRDGTMASELLWYRLDIAHVSQLQMAQECGVHESTYVTWETNRNFPKGQNARRLLEVIESLADFANPMRNDPDTAKARDETITGRALI